MTEQQEQKGLPKRRLSDHKRLESWKAIANYLQRSVRTVRRWESDEGLPVHRHKHSKGASVFAYCSELDAWRSVHRKSIVPESQQAESPPPSRLATRGAVAAYIAVAVIATFAGVVAGRFVGVDDAPGRVEMGSADAWVLIASPVIDETVPNVDASLTQALRREIGSVYPVLPEHRIRKVLSLMRVDPDSGLSPSIAREVALRYGRVNALLLPRVERLGDAYVLSAEIVDPHTDQLIGYPGEMIRDTQAVLPAIGRLTTEVRAVLAGVALNKGTGPMPPVTTSSLSALQLYSRAILCMEGNQPAVALELLGQAIEQDPHFASARTLQALAMQQNGDHAEEYLRVSGIAMELGADVTPAERYFNQGSHYHLAGDLPRADASYRALLEVNPQHLPGAKALLDVCLATKHHDRCVDQRVRLAQMQPDNFDFNVEAAWLLAMQGGETALANKYANKALELWRTNGQHFSPAGVARVLMLPLFNAWSANDLELALNEDRQLKELLPSLPREIQEVVIGRLVGFSITLGRLDDAAALVVQLSDSQRQRELHAGILFASGDKKRLGEYLASDTEFDDATSALLMAMSGLPDRAMQLHDRLLSGDRNATAGAIIRASIAIGNGDIESARSELAGTVPNLNPDDKALFFAGYDMYASVLKADGQLDDAIRVLEMTTPARTTSVFGGSGVYWLMCQRQLARFYRDAGRDYDATALEHELRQLLVLADEDFPLNTSLDQA